MNPKIIFLLTSTYVIPAKAGIQGLSGIWKQFIRHWIPARASGLAGMTNPRISVIPAKAGIQGLSGIWKQFIRHWIPARAFGLAGMTNPRISVIPAKAGIQGLSGIWKQFIRHWIPARASSLAGMTGDSNLKFAKKRILELLLLPILLLLTACSAPLLELPCVDLPGTPETCPGDSPSQNAEQIGIAWDCPECSSIRQGTAPLAVQLWLKNVPASAEAPVLWEISGLNSDFYERDFSRPDEKFVYTFERQETYRVQATFNKQAVEPVEFRVDLNEISAKWSTPWRSGELCDARLHFLGDPEQAQQAPYWVEVVVKADGLENLSVIDRVPYRVKFPEYTQSWRITPQKSAKPYRFPTQLQPQVIEFDGSGRRNLIWDILVKCISPNQIEEFSITTRL